MKLAHRIWGIVVPLFFLAAIVSGCAVTRSVSGRIELSTKEADLGAVPNTAPVSRTFEVRNVGQGWLEITGVSTSCGCTTAEVADRHLPPGGSTTLLVTFDPQAHEGKLGTFLRQVYIRSTDPETPEAVLTFRVTVVQPQAQAEPFHELSTPIPAPGPAVVYYNRACTDCLEYIQETIVPLLRRAGLPEPTYKDYVNEPANRDELRAQSERVGIPPTLWSHLILFLGDRIILEGHIPEHLVAELLAAPSDAFERIVVYQDKMSGAVEYTIWAFRGEPQTYPLDTPLSEYLAYLEAHGGHLLASPSVENQSALLPLVLVSGFLDGLNPCAFAVLLFFIAFLFSIRRTAATI
ncbi:MAG: DUF1573 domain-containing protein [Anaerolineae bacterium]